MKDNKKKIWIPILIVGILIIIVGICILNPTINSAINKEIEVISIEYDKKMYGYSEKEITKKLENTKLTYNSYDLFKIEDSITAQRDETFVDEVYANVEYFEYFGEISYSINDDTVKSFSVDPNTFTINIMVKKPTAVAKVYEDEINYLDADLGLLSIRDLHLSDDELKTVKEYGETKMLQSLESEDNTTKAIEAETKLYEEVYADILKDIEGISLFRINVIVED